MLLKLFKYFKQFPPIFTVAAALNPIFNKRQVCNFLELIEDYVTTDHFSSEENIKIFEDAFNDLFRYYKNVNPSTRTAQPQNVGGSSRSTGKSFFGLLGKQSSKRVRTDSSSSLPVDELGVYSSNIFTFGDIDYENFDILNWWFNKRNDYPILAIMARDVLTVQASTVASESCFSTSGRLISARRTNLTAESVELCICLKDYLDSVDRVQNTTTLEDSALDGLEEDLLVGSEQTSYTSGTDDQSYTQGSSDVYTPQMVPDSFETLQPQQPLFQPTTQFQQPFFQFEQSTRPMQPNFLSFSHYNTDFQPFQHFIQPPNQFQSFYNTEDQMQPQQQRHRETSQAYRPREINEDESDEDEQNDDNEDEEVNETDEE